MLPSTAVGTIEFRSVVEPIRKANEFLDYYEASCTKINYKDQVGPQVWKDAMKNVIDDELWPQLLKKVREIYCFAGHYLQDSARC